MPLFQRYVSPELTHFVGRSLKSQERQYRLLKRIIKSGTLRARPRPRGRNSNVYTMEKHRGQKLSSNDAYKGSSVCFCDIPLDDLAIHISKYSKFGIAFSKDFLAGQGALPVLYVPVRGRPSLLPFLLYGPGAVSSQAVAFDQFWRRFNRVEAAIGRLAASPHEKRTADDLRNVIEFLDFNILSNLKFFHHGLHDVHEKNFYMEREWRVSRDVEFNVCEVQRIIIPARFSRRLRNDLKAYDGEVFFAD
jgi:hypothetical protein